MPIEFTIDGSPATCPDGLTVAGALALAGRRTVRLTGRLADPSPERGEPRGILCGMGVCFECVMEIDGRPGVRSCMTLVRPGMRVVTQRGAARLGEQP